MDRRVAVEAAAEAVVQSANMRLQSIWDEEEVAVDQYGPVVFQAALERADMEDLV